MIDETFSDGIARPILLHLKPAIEQDDTVTQTLPQAQQYNPFFSRTPVPQSTTRHTGVKISTNEVQYDGHIVVGPLSKDEDTTGMGELLDNQARVTLVIEALPHIEQTIKVTIEGRKYRIDETRPIGFSQRRYIIVQMTEIQEITPKTPDSTIG